MGGDDHRRRTDAFVHSRAPVRQKAYGALPDPAVSEQRCRRTVCLLLFPKQKSFTHGGTDGSAAPDCGRLCGNPSDGCACDGAERRQKAFSDSVHGAAACQSGLRYCIHRVLDCPRRRAVSHAVLPFGSGADVRSVLSRCRGSVRVFRARGGFSPYLVCLVWICTSDRSGRPPDSERRGSGGGTA